ncbi:MAG TPA: MaoC family dehydratase [Trebonia sp.]|jgi:acyl dehydratase|nr:MaoC family dehydratase [Trebonia sp.]
MTDAPGHPVRYLEDYVPGLVIDCGGFDVDEAQIIEFARQYDPQPFHVDPAAAAAGPFGGIIASGWHTISLMMRRVVERYLDPGTSLGAAGVDEVRWPRPVRPGDQLRVRATVLEARRSRSKPDRGVVRTRFEVTTAGGETAMTLIAINLVLARPSDS